MLKHDLLLLLHLTLHVLLYLWLYECAFSWLRWYWAPSTCRLKQVVQPVCEEHVTSSALQCRQHASAFLEWFFKELVLSLSCLYQLEGCVRSELDFSASKQFQVLQVKVWNLNLCPCWIEISEQDDYSGLETHVEEFRIDPDDLKPTWCVSLPNSKSCWCFAQHSELFVL